MVPPPLTKQLLQLHHPDQKYSNEAIELSAELLKLFIVEARRRAKIEVSLVNTVYVVQWWQLYISADICMAFIISY